MIKIVEKPEEQKNDSLELSVKDTICCWNDDDASVAKNYLMVAKFDDFGGLKKPYTIIALNNTNEQCSATNENDKLVEYFYSDLDDLVQDIVNSYDHVRKVDLVATAKESSKESSNDED